MALDGQRIEQRHAPAGRGGGDGIAAAASELVRSIVEAAEESATRIAEEAARRVAPEHPATSEMLERVRAMEAELAELVDRLRPAAGDAATAPGDVEGARLVALNMALDGTPRAQTERYLAERFGPADR